MFTTYEVGQVTGTYCAAVLKDSEYSRNSPVVIIPNIVEINS